MMTPEGSPTQSTISDGTQNSMVSHASGRVGQIEYDAPERGRFGIQARWKIAEKADDGTEKFRTCSEMLPPIAGRYTNGDGIIYLVPTTWGTLYHAPATELAKGETWTKLGYHEAARWRRSDDRFATWLAVADKWPISSKSPRVSEGLPPLAPDLAPLTEDAIAARDAWADTGVEMSPRARLVIGAALMSPWMPECGIESSVIGMWGEAGEGKSFVAKCAAALYGTPVKGKGLFRTFNSTGRGVPSRAVQLSYLPIILDEVQNSTGDIEPMLVELVQGAQRARANRSGAAVDDDGTWMGLVITTGNEPLPLRAEQFNRRALQVQADELWSALPPADDWAARGQFWATIANRLRVMAGWPWVELQRQFTPGTEAVGAVPLAVAQMPLPGPGNLGMLANLAIFGCRWLRDWTGEDAWDEGVFDAAAAMIAERRIEISDPARDAARSILDSLVASPAYWTDAHDSRETYGWPEPGATSRHRCEVAHPGIEHCTWLNILPAPFAEIVPDDPRRLARTRFAQASLSTDSKGMQRRVTVSGHRARVYTVCTHALGVLADDHACDEPTDSTPAIAAPTTERFAATPAPFAVEPTPPVQAAPVQVGPTPRRWCICEDTDREDTASFVRALNRAEAEGATHLAGPTWWRPAHLGDGWDAGSWQGIGTGRVYVRRGQTRIEVWRSISTSITVSQFADGLERFMTETGHEGFASVPALGQHLVRAAKPGRMGAPRWQLPPEQVEAWTVGGIMHSLQWNSGQQVETVDFDRNKSYLPAFTQASIAPLFYGETYEHYEGTCAPVDRRLAGMYRIEVPAWHSPLPAPHVHHEAGSQLWITSDMIAMYGELGITPRIIEAYLAPRHSLPQIEAFSTQVKLWLSEFEGRDARIIPKALYQSFARNLTAPHNQGRRMDEQRIFRPDWGNAIADNSWCAVIRTAYRAYMDHPDFVPVRCNVDALYYPREVIEKHGAPPRLKLGTGLGQWKVETPDAPDLTPKVVATGREFIPSEHTAPVETLEPAEPITGPSIFGFVGGE